MKWNKVSDNSFSKNEFLLLYFPDEHYEDLRFRIGRYIYDIHYFDGPQYWAWSCQGFSSSKEPTYWAKLEKPE